MQVSTILLSGAVADALGAYGTSIAGTTGQVAGLALEALIRRRIGSARDILIDEIKRGDKMLHSVGDIEEAVAVTYRYARAAQEGAARLNLRLMAKVIAGQAHLGNLVADEFLYYADVLASLRREEIILIATLHYHRCRLEQAGDVLPNMEELWRLTVDDLVPVLFADERNARATAGAALRTGLIMTDNTLDGLGYFTTSPLMDRLERLAPFREALEREAQPVDR